MKKNWVALAAGLLGLLIAATLLIYFDLKEFARSAGGTGAAEHVLTIPPGQPLAATAEMLQHHQLISSAFKFRMLARLEGYDRRLKAGECCCTTGVTPRLWAR
jgi:UPF0755 protein